MDFKNFKQNYQKKEIDKFPNTVGKNPLLSVCVQTYEHENFITQCLEGILMQKTNFTFEVLLGDDGSIDKTRQICLEYAKKYPEKIRLFLHHRENNIVINGNPTGRFNLAYNIFSSNGQYIAICEGDDYWTDPYKLQKQVSFLESNKEYSLCFHHVKILTPLGVLTNDFITKIPKKYQTLENFAENGNYIHTPTVVFRNIIKVFPLEFFYVSFGDYFLYFLLAKHGNFYCLKKNMAVYRYGLGVISKMNPKQILLNNMTLYTGLISNAPSDEIKKILLERQKEIFDFYFERAAKKNHLSIRKQIRSAFRQVYQKFFS